MRPVRWTAFAQRAALGDRQRRGLLQVDVLARLDGRDRRQRVPVVRRADHDRVDVLAREQVAVVAVRLHAVVRLAGLLRVVAVHEQLRVLGAPAVEVAHGDDPRLLVLPDARQVVRARDAAGADRADVDAVARRGRAEDRGRHDRGEAGGERGAADAPTRSDQRLPARDPANARRHHDLLSGTSLRERQLLRRRLRLQHQLHRGQAQLLAHRRLGAVERRRETSRSP